MNGLGDGCFARHGTVQPEDCDQGGGQRSKTLTANKSYSLQPVQQDAGSRGEDLSIQHVQVTNT